MKYDKNKLEKQALEIIASDSDVVFLEDVIAGLPCSSATFFNYELERLESIKEGIIQNRQNKKKKLRAKWDTNDNPTLQIALYKLIGSDKELSKLTGQHIDHTTKGESINQPKIPDKVLAAAYKQHLENQDAKSDD